MIKIHCTKKSYSIEVFQRLFSSSYTFTILYFKNTKISWAIKIAETFIRWYRSSWSESRKAGRFNGFDWTKDNIDESISSNPSIAVTHPQNCSDELAQVPANSSAIFLISCLSLKGSPISYSSRVSRAWSVGRMTPRSPQKLPNPTSKDRHMSHFMPSARKRSVASSMISGDMTPPDPFSGAFCWSFSCRGYILFSTVEKDALFIWRFVWRDNQGREKYFLDPLSFPIIFLTHQPSL